MPQAENKSITFDAPPVREVSLGRIFLPRPDFLLPYYGAFWAEIQSRFPKAEHANPVVAAGDQADDALFLPRVLFISEDSAQLVQLQNNRYHFNWRRIDSLGNEYIRFPTVLSECLKYWETLGSFVRTRTGTPLQPVKAELTYTNFIDHVDGVGESITELAKYALRDFGWKSEQRFLSMPTSFSQSASFAIDDVGVLQINVAALMKKDTKLPALRLDLTVRGDCKEESSFEHWSHAAHEFLVSAFKDLTTPEMHKVWKLRE